MSLEDTIKSAEEKRIRELRKEFLSMDPVKIDEELLHEFKVKSYLMQRLSVMTESTIEEAEKIAEKVIDIEARLSEIKREIFTKISNGKISTPEEARDLGLSFTVTENNFGSFDEYDAVKELLGGTPGVRN